MYRSLVHESGLFMGECLRMDSYVVTTGEESISSGWWCSVFEFINME